MFIFDIIALTFLAIVFRMSRTRLVVHMGVVLVVGFMALVAGQWWWPLYYVGLNYLVSLTDDELSTD